MESRSTIRQHMRRRRQSLSAPEQSRAASRAARYALSAPELRIARHVALYLPNDGELDPRALVRHLWRRHTCCYLPVLSRWRHGQLLFARYSRRTMFRANRFGIPEPRADRLFRATELDLVFLPLVAFDRHGNRLGMGGGYYDRTLGPLYRRPMLIGMAHEAQYYPELPAESWDVPLNALVTDKGLTHLQRPTGRLRT